MLEPHRAPSPGTSPTFPPSLIGERRHAAKWPPDDDASGPSGGAGGGGGGPGDFDPGDGNFKRGRFRIGAVLAGLGITALAVALAVGGFKQEAARLSMPEIAAQKKSIYVLPKAEQLPKWRELAKSSTEYELRSEALQQVAWADDKEGVALAGAALGDVDHRLRGVAAQVLAYYGTPAADGAKPQLQKALAEATEADRPQIVWALVALQEPTALDTALDLYRKGHLAKVQRLGGGNAFDAAQMASLVPVDKLPTLAADESSSVRQLVAVILSKKADAKFTDTLIKLVRDPDIEVAREAATGLGKIADDKARGPLLEALGKADKDSRQKFLEALRDGIGGEGLALALGSVSKEKPETNWHQSKQLFDIMRKVADPRVGDALMSYLKSNPHFHWKTEAALRLAEVGDLRAVPYLAERMKMDPLKVYSDASDYEKMAKRDDNPRVVSARMLADLAVLHPEAAEQIRKDAEDAVIGWIHEKPQPHANGLRFLSASGSTKDIAALRKWADPTVGLPKEGQQPPMPDDWVIAQTALRYLGWLKDPTSWGTLERQMKRRDPKVDVTQEALMGSGLAILGMSLRGLGVGAAQGFAQWGDPKAFPILVKYVEDEKENEQARIEACSAIPWVATDENMQEVVKKVNAFSQKEPKKQFIRGCYLEALVRRPQLGTSAGLVDMLDKSADLEVRHQVARAIGIGGFDEKVQAKLFDKLADPEVRDDAALALVLGGGPEIATRAVAMFADYPKEQLDDLKDIYYRTFGFWSDDDLAKGRVYKWVQTAEAIARIRVRDTQQDWARQRLSAQFDNLEFDNGPHSMTRVVLRYRVVADAKKGDLDRKKGAIATLKFMKEQGSLMALRAEPGDTGKLAAQAFFELMNPKLVEAETLPAVGKNGKDVEPK